MGNGRWGRSRLTCPWRRDRAREQRAAPHPGKTGPRSDPHARAEGRSARPPRGPPRHQLPAVDLLARPDAGRPRIADPHRRHRRRLRDDQPGRGPLRVVFRHQGVWNAALARAAARERGHDHSIGKTQITDDDRIEELGHCETSVRRQKIKEMGRRVCRPARGQPPDRRCRKYR